MSRVREKILKGARHLRLFCFEQNNDEKAVKREENKRSEQEAHHGKIRKFLAKFDYLQEAFVFASNFFQNYFSKYQYSKL